MTAILLIVVAISLVLSLPMWLLVFYALWIQHERGGAWKACHVFGVPGGLLDIGLNYTLCAALFEAWPEAGAYTFSKQLAYLQHCTGKRGDFARPLVEILNRIAPSGKHI